MTEVQQSVQVRRRSWRETVVAAGGNLADAALGVAMRVPGLFIIDHWWQFRWTPGGQHNLDIMRTLVNNIGELWLRR